MNLRNIYSLMLRDKFGDAEINKLALDAEEQIRYSIRFLIKDLQKMGFSEKHAKLTAIQIAPKPILYSLIIRNRILDDPELIPDFPDNYLGKQKEIEYRRLQYQMLAPEFTAFLFDQIIDEYNDQNENSDVKKMVDHASHEISRTPDFYLQKIKQLEALCMKKNHISDEDLADKGLNAFRLLVPLIYIHKRAKATNQEISDLLYTVADVLTHEQTVSSAYNKGRYYQDSFLRPTDFIDFVNGESQSMSDTPIDTVSRGILRNQGLLMVAISQYMIIRSPIFYDRVSGSFGLLRKPGVLTVRDILHQNTKLIQLIRFFELIVRAGDDIGDLEIDRKAQAPNCILIGYQGLKTLLHASGIEAESRDKEIDPSGKLKEAFLAFFQKAMNGQVGNNSLLTELRDMKELGMAKIGILTKMKSVDDSHLLACILNEVAYGAIFNAICNDIHAENLGNEVMNTYI